MYLWVIETNLLTYVAVYFELFTQHDLNHTRLC